MFFLKCFLAHFILSVIGIFAFVWGLRAPSINTFINYGFAVIICCGYILAGYLINSGNTNVTKSILLVYLLSGIIIAFLGFDIISLLLWDMKSLFEWFNLSSLPLWQCIRSDLFKGNNDLSDRVLICVLGILPSGLIHIGVIIKACRF
jgi:hypothetical protein